MDPRNKLYTTDDTDIITLTSNDGEDVDFLQVADMYLNDIKYCIVLPVEAIKNNTPSPGVLLRYLNEEEFELELDDDVTEQVLEEFKAFVEIMRQKEENAKPEA